MRIGDEEWMKIEALIESVFKEAFSMGFHAGLQKARESLEEEE